MGEGSMPELGRRRARLHQDRQRRRRALPAGRAGAAGQANGDLVAALVGRAQGERQAVCRSGRLGRAVATTFTRRGRRCVQDTQEHCWLGTRLYQPQGNFAAASRTASALHLFAHGLRGQVGQALVLGTHDGFEAQAIRGASHTRSHACPVTSAVSLRQGTGATVGKRARRSLFLGLPGQGVQSRCLGTLDHGGGSQGAAAVGGFVASGFGQILRACRARSSLGGGEGWRFLEADKCATFPFWAFGTILPGCSGAITAAKLMLATLLKKRVNPASDLQALECCRRHFGTRGPPRWFRSSRRSCQALDGGPQARDLPLSKGKSKVLIDGTDKLKQGLLQLGLLGIDECDTARNVGADLQLGKRRRACVVKGGLARAATRTRRGMQLRKAGAHTRNLTLTGSNAGVL